MAKVGDKFVGPNDQVHEVVEDTGDGYRVDIHAPGGGTYPNTWTFSYHQFDRMMDSLPLSVAASIIRPVLADANRKLQFALSKRNFDKTETALRLIVAASLPAKRTMPEFENRTIYRGTGGPHVAYKWVSARGMTVLLVEAPLGEEWGTLVVSAFETYPGANFPKRLLYRDVTDNTENLPLLVQQAVRYL